jgi:hypothetical protein
LRFTRIQLRRCDASECREPDWTRRSDETGELATPRLRLCERGLVACKSRWLLEQDRDVEGIEPLAGRALHTRFHIDRSGAALFLL